MTIENAVLKRKCSGEPVIGTFAQTRSPEFCEIASRAGFDFVIIDMEHGSFGIEGAVEMIRAVETNGAVAVVRVPDHSPTNIYKVLDAGAMGVVVPIVSTGDQAQAIAAAAKYGPQGKRGACPCTRGTGHGVDDWNEYLDWARQNVFISALIETTEAIDNFDAIIGTPGIDFISLGPFDLSQAMGFEGDYANPEVQTRMEDLAKRALARGVGVMAISFAGDHATLKADYDRWIGLGVNVMVLSGDRFVISTAMKATVQAVRANNSSMG